MEEKAKILAEDIAKKEKDAKKRDMIERERLARHEEMKKWKVLKEAEAEQVKEQVELQKQTTGINKKELAKHQDRLRNELAAKSQQLKS